MRRDGFQRRVNGDIGLGVQMDWVVKTQRVTWHTWRETILSLSPAQRAQRLPNEMKLTLPTRRMD